MSELIPIETIATKILIIRGKKVLIDSDLAKLYAIETKGLKRAVRRNIERFPEDFMFEITKEEYDSLRSQFGTLKRGAHAKYLPYVFTEQGIAMLSSVLNSPQAVKVNIQIMRAFVKLREFMLSNKELHEKIDAMERKYDKQFKIVFDALRTLLETPKSKIKKIGFKK